MVSMHWSRAHDNVHTFFTIAFVLTIWDRSGLVVRDSASYAGGRVFEPWPIHDKDIYFWYKQMPRWALAIKRFV